MNKEERGALLELERLCRIIVFYKTEGELVKFKEIIKLQLEEISKTRKGSLKHENQSTMF